MELNNILVSKGKTANARYVAVAATETVRLPQQAADVYRAMDEIGMTVVEIAGFIETKTKQPKERIVRYYLPLLMKEGLVVKA